MNSKIIISNNMRGKCKQSFFALHQIYHKIKTYKPDVDVEFHINWGSNKMGGMCEKDVEKFESEKDENDKWSKLIDEHFNHCIKSYDRAFLKNYVEKAYGYVDDGKFDRFDAIYLLLLPHYLRRVLLEDYYLIYDDDIIINDDFHNIIDLILDKVPVLINEPLNRGCDKVLAPKIFSLYQNDGLKIYKERNSNELGFNAGFQGIDLSIFDDFLSTDRFYRMLSLFNYNGILDSNGNEIWGPERSLIDTQQQSFFGLTNIIKSKNDPYILPPIDYFVIPNFGNIENPKHGKLNRDDGMDGWGLALKSKITHFIGHTQGMGKPKVFQDYVNIYLKEKGFL